MADAVQDADISFHITFPVYLHSRLANERPAHIFYGNRITALRASKLERPLLYAVYFRDDFSVNATEYHLRNGIFGFTLHQNA